MAKKVKKVDKIKFLGVIIDDQLSWNDQIEHDEHKILSTMNNCSHKTYKNENLPLFI